MFPCLYADPSCQLHATLTKNTCVLAPAGWVSLVFKEIFSESARAIRVVLAAMVSIK